MPHHQPAAAIREPGGERRAAVNPPAIKAIPAGGEATAELAEVYSGLFRQIQYRSNATHVFANAVYYAVACGIGHFRIVTDYADDDGFDQEILIKRIQHPLSVFWAPGAVEPDRSDAEYCLVSEMIGRKEFQKRFPGAAMADFMAPSDLNAESGLFWANRDAVRVCEYWVKRPHERTIARLANGETIDITEVAPKELRGLQIVAERKVKSHKVEHYLLSGEEVLEGPNQWAGRYIPIFPVIGSETALETKVIRSGLVRFSRDSQQLYNFWRSAAAEAIALAPRAPFVATPAMIAKFKGQWDTQNTVSRPYLLYEPDPDVPGGRPMREPPPDIPSALVQRERDGRRRDEGDDRHLRCVARRALERDFGRCHPRARKPGRHFSAALSGQSDGDAEPSRQGADRSHPQDLRQRAHHPHHARGRKPFAGAHQCAGDGCER